MSSSQSNPVDLNKTFGVRRPHLAGEFAVLIGLLVVYDRIRKLAPARVSEAVVHGFDIFRLEGPIAFERAFNLWMADHARLDAFSVTYYQFLHIPTALAALAWCYIFKPLWYRPIRNALVVTNIVGLFIFAAYPVAPPRLLPQAGFIDLVARAGFGRSHGPFPMDAYAAVPSLHVAWAVCIAMVGLSASRSRPVRTLFVLHPVITSVVVVGTANHYVFDVATGLALALGASLATGLGRRQRPLDAPLLSDPVPQYTMVAFHAHPDDETLFTGGTIARAAAAGHRVVLVVATLGESGLADGDCSDLGERRSTELAAAAAELGISRWEWLGYADSGRFGDGPRTPETVALVDADIDTAARALADILIDEGADVLTTYDAAGGYGHPDHVRVHQIGARAAEIADTPSVLQATIDRSRALGVSRLLAVIPGLPDELRPASVGSAFVPHDRLTHRIDVRPYIDQKRGAMRAHVSQQTGGDGMRSLALYLRLPEWIFRRAFGTEWFVETGRTPAAPLLDDIFASVRTGDPIDASRVREPADARSLHRGADAVEGLSPAEPVRPMALTDGASA